MLRVRVLGGLQLESSSGALPPIPSRLGRSLFAYLVLNRERPATRDLLAGLFWPDMSEAKARRRLSQALWQIQTVLAVVSSEEEFILATPSSVQFNPRESLWLDAEEFDRRLLEAKAADPEDADAYRLLREAVALYQGDLLAGFYDDWMLVSQEAYRKRYLEALEGLTRLAKARGALEEALEFAGRITLQDPLLEEAHREIMRLSFLVGRPNDALRQYEVCRAVLAEQLGTHPTEATRSLRDAIARRRDSAAMPLAASVRTRLYDARIPPALVGRGHEREVLISRMEEALGGTGSVVLVESQPGIGKTRLLQEVAADAHWRGLSVMWGESGHDTGMAPYGLLTAALASGLSPLRAEQIRQQVPEVWLSNAARIIPELAVARPASAPTAHLRPEEQRQVLAESLHRVFGAVGDLTPHLVVLDDVHQADDDTVETLPALADALARRPMVLCLSYRGDEARARTRLWQALQRIDRMPRRERLVLPGLSQVETAELVRTVTRDRPPPQVLQRLHAETGGNPLFVLETLRAVHEASVRRAVQSIEWTTEDWPDEQDFPVSSTVRDVVVQRLAPLAPEARHVLNVLAVLGSPGELPVLAGITGIQRAGLLTSLEGLMGRGFVVEVEGRYRTSHEQVRRVVYDEIDPAERSRLHLNVATTLDDLGSVGPEVLGHHFLAARDVSRAIRHLTAAGEQAALVGAYATAAGLYGLAVAHLDGSGLSNAQQAQLFIRNEAVLDVLGRREEQAEMLERAARLGDLADRRLSLLRRVWLLANTDRLDEARDVAIRCAELARADGDTLALAGALTALGTTRLWAGRPTEAIEDLRRAVAAASGAPGEEARARCALGAVMSGVQQYAAAEEQLHLARRLYEGLDDRRGLAEVLGYLAIVRMEQGDAREAESLYRAGLELCVQIGYRHGEGVNLVNLANALYQLGRLSEALGLYSRAAELFSTVGNRRGEAIVLVNSASLRLNFLGETETALEEAGRAVAYFDEVQDQRGQALGMQITALVEERGRRFARADGILARALAAARRAGDRRLEAQLLRSRAHLALARGAPDAAVDVANEALQLCTELGFHDIEGLLLGVLGRATMATGALDDAERLLTEARRLLAPGSDRAVCVPFWHFEVLEAAGRYREAQTALEAARRLVEDQLAGVSHDQAERARRLVPEYRDIEEALRSRRPVTKTVRLARMDAPTGRAPNDDERVDVTWTIASRDDEQAGTRQEVRRNRIIRLVREAVEQGAVPTVGDLAEALGVSTATLRRDLARLRTAGTPVKTRGTIR